MKIIIIDDKQDKTSLYTFSDSNADECMKNVLDAMMKNDVEYIHKRR